MSENPFKPPSDVDPVVNSDAAPRPRPNDVPSMKLVVGLVCYCFALVPGVLAALSVIWILFPPRFSAADWYYQNAKIFVVSSGVVLAFVFIGRLLRRNPQYTPGYKPQPNVEHPPKNLADSASSDAN